MTDDVTSAYDGIARAWAAGPAFLYETLARVIVAAYPHALPGQHVLDAGAGTGAVSVVLRERGARVTAVDSAPDMVAHARSHGFDAAVGDLRSLPFGDSSFDGYVAAFSLSHVDDPIGALTEARRVVRGRGAVLAGVFAEQQVNPSKEVVDAVAESFGFVPPRWYRRLKNDLEPRSNTPDRLLDCARAAGLMAISVEERVVDTGITTPEDIVRTRVGMAHLAPFMASLTPARHEQFVTAAVAAVAQDPHPLRPAILVLSSRVRA